MAGKWDDEDESSSGSVSGSETGAPAPAPLLRRSNKFEDEEEDDSDVLDSWDADDSEVEREKAKKEQEAKAAAAAAAAAALKAKKQSIAEKKAERARQQAEADAEAAMIACETEAERRERLRRNEQDADLQHAADMFGDAGLSAGTGTRKSAAVLKASAISVSASDPTKTVDLGSLPLLNPTTKQQFDKLQLTLGPIISAHSQKGPYVMFAQNFIRELCKSLPSDQIKKINSSLTALANDRLREEKASEKGGKKTKAAKTKTTLAIARPSAVDTSSYDDVDYGE
ncbi:Translation initiation factor 3 subunit J component [Sporothrix epigloea]|uniref:Eukaryotic translation initiation factor 3 subunit J n=1 Tax=Sporothrix epigloea TaxID=1892477 RepID=A0ABP0DLZ5_9PEZI